MPFMLSKVSNIARSPGDPKVLEAGPSSLKPADRAGRALGWFSIGLGLTELIAPGVLTRALGMRGKEGWSALTGRARSPRASSASR